VFAYSWNTLSSYELIVTHLRRGGSAEALAPSGEPLLHQAIIDDEPESVALLVRQRAEPTRLDRLGFTAVQLAQVLGRQGCLTCLQSLPVRRIAVAREGTGLIDELTTPEFEAWTGVAYAPFLVANDLGALRFACRLARRAHRKGFFTTQRRWLSRWHALEMNEGHTCRTFVKWIDSRIGYGLFAHGELPAWAYVGVYTGLLRRRDLFAVHTNDYCFRYPVGASGLRPLLIDAEPIGNELRYANHSDRPNMEGIGIPWGPLVQVVLRTTRLVRSGEQLTYDYGADYWKARHYLKRLI
jgi:uncharacterized protein